MLLKKCFKRFVAVEFAQSKSLRNFFQTFFKLDYDQLK